MDIATVIGLVGGTILVAVSILIGGSFSVFINIPGLLIVVGGTSGIGDIAGVGFGCVIIDRQSHIAGIRYGSALAIAAPEQ